MHAIAKHYQPLASDDYLDRLVAYSELSISTKINCFNEEEFHRLLLAIEKLCGYQVVGNEKFEVLPKIIALIENGEDKEDTYLIGNFTVLTKLEAIEWIKTHRLDALVVHQANGQVHLRSRPHHCMHYLQIGSALLGATEGQINPLVRTIGTKRQGQCIWGFINGISNTRDISLKSATLISDAAGGEEVLLMPNDCMLGGIIDLFICGMLKTGGDTAIVSWAVRFMRYLLGLSEQDNQSLPVILFAHSQGAIICEHAIEQLSVAEREKIRIVTFGGGSFIAPNKCHSDSHNYVSAIDIVCGLGSPELRQFALAIYHGQKESRGEDEVIFQLATWDVMLATSSHDVHVFKMQVQERVSYYRGLVAQIRNVTILDPPQDTLWEHRFASGCYQEAMQSVVSQFRLAQMALQHKEASCERR